MTIENDILAYARRFGERPPRRAPLSPHLKRLEAEAIHIMREVAAEFRNPVLLYSIGKDSTVLLHLAMKAFWPAKPPFPFLHIDSRWEFAAMGAFRDALRDALGLDIRVHVNPEAVERNIDPFVHGSALHTQISRTDGLLQALNEGGYDAAFGGGRRDEEKSRAKERIFSFRNEAHGWDPKNQRPELWNIYNTRIRTGESIRVFPISNWTELDVWRYIYEEEIPVVPLYFAAPRPVVERDGQLIMVDDERMPLECRRDRSRAFSTLSHPWLLSADRRRRERGDAPGGRALRNADGTYLRAPGPGHRFRRAGLDGSQETSGVFLMGFFTSASSFDPVRPTPGPSPQARRGVHASTMKCSSPSLLAGRGWGGVPLLLSHTCRQT